MQIIRISPRSFKIILTHDDLALSGIDSKYDYYGFSKDFFTKVIDEANKQYGADFGSGVIDAEFFEDKNGGGELFLCEVESCRDSNIYGFFAQSSEDIVRLCKRLKNSLVNFHSSLYYHDTKYILLLCLCDDKDILLSIIKEYGDCRKITKIEMWAIEEHAKTIIENKAVEFLSST